MSALTADQLLALRVWQTCQGRRWKDNLRWAWETGNYDTPNVGVASVLQQLRNEFGPLWLIAYRPGDTKVGYLQAVELPPFPTPRQLFRGHRTAWQIVDSAGQVLLAPQHTKSDARRFCQNNHITLIEDPK